MRILVTGAAGFIGFSVANALINEGHIVSGVDNLNDYYDVNLKLARLKKLLIHDNFSHHQVDISDQQSLESVFKIFKPDRVIHLAAQAGVRYSIENPMAYVNSNVVGFTNVLENCRHYSVEHLVYASTSSVYGANTQMPFSVHHNVDHPLSFYAATKKANELMAHTYSHLYELPTTGLRFFTVYGPWGRPDMALFKFTKAILEDQPIDVFNYGNHRRDFTYVDDIVKGIIRVLEKSAKVNHDWDSSNPDPSSSMAPWRLYNIGNNRPVDLMEYIRALESALNKKAKINFLPLQPGDVPDTYADVTDLVNDFDYKPNTEVSYGVEQFVNWYKEYEKSCVV